MIQTAEQSGLGLFIPEEVLGRFQILRPLGQGGMGDVFLARSLELDVLVAIKVMRSLSDPDQVRRFMRECEVLTRLDHPHIIGLYEYGMGNAGPYMIMPFVEGKTLAQAPPIPDPAGFMVQVAQALQAIHEVRLVHRDVKPANIMVSATGQALLIDFGVVLDQDQTKLTSTGGMVGTLSYMAPELLMGQRASPASDWYAWGATTYQLLEGSVPFITGDLMAAAHVGVLRPPRLEKLRDFPGLAEAVLRALSYEPSQRPKSFREIQELIGEGGRGAVPLQDRPESFLRCLAAPSVGSRDQGAQRHYRAGLERAQGGDAEGARDSFLRAVGSDPEAAEVWTELGIVLTHLGRWEEGLEAAEKALRKAPRNLDALRCQGLCQERLGRGGGAVESFRRFLQEAPEDLEELRQDAIARIKAFEEGETLSGQTSVGALLSTWSGLASSTRQPAPEPKPEPKPVVEASLEERECLRAEAIPSKTPRCDPPLAVPSQAGPADEFYAEALERLRAKDEVEGEDALRRAFARDPRHHASCRELGILLTNQDRYSEAIRPLDEAISLDPDDYEVIRFRAIALEKLERGEEAELAFRAFLEKAPRSAARARAHAEKRLEEMIRRRRTDDSDRALATAVVPLDDLPHRTSSPFPWVRILLLLLGLGFLGGSVVVAIQRSSPEYLESVRPLRVSLVGLSSLVRRLEDVGGDPELRDLFDAALRRGVGRGQGFGEVEREDLYRLFHLLGESGDRESVRALGATLDSDDDLVRVAAVRSLALNSSPETVRLLNRILLERLETPMVVESLEALEVLTSMPGAFAAEVLGNLFGRAAFVRKSTPENEVFFGLVQEAVWGRPREEMCRSLEVLVDRLDSDRSSGGRTRQGLLRLLLEELNATPQAPPPTGEALETP